MSVAQILRSPYLKGKGFNPNPIARSGIPKEADSILNPKVIGTPAHEAYWNEQLYYIRNGFQTGGLFIPGRYYYYLNFNNMSTINGIITPDMVDLHLEMAYTLEYAKANGLDVIVAKKRRAGVSEFAHKCAVDYDYRFTNGAYKCGVAAGQDTFAQEFMEKWRASEVLLPPELRISKLKDNNDEVIAGYRYKVEDGNVTFGGTRNAIYVRTMFRNPALFKGFFLNFILAEECGEFENLMKFIFHSMACMKDGSKKIGTLWAQGTSGDMNKGSRDFEQVWQEAKRGVNTFIPMPILAPRFHKPFYGACSLGDPITPNLLKENKPFEIIGCEDIKAAEETLISERQEILKSKNQEKYQEHLRDYPMSETELFRKTIVNVFDAETMQNQMDRISSEKLRYFKGRLEWVKDEKGEAVHPLKVEFVADDTIEDDYAICIHQDHIHPITTHSSLYVGGADSYDQDKAKTSKSKGAMCVLIRRNTMPNQMQLAPVAVICARPRRKEIFYEMCLKLAIHFNLIESVLIDVANKLIFKYFEERGYSNMLAYRPRKFESEHSEQTHIYGLHINNYSKPLMVGEMQSAILDYGNQIWFDELLKQLANYDEVEIGSDNDLADAYGIALVMDRSMDVGARDNKEYTDPATFQLPEWTTVNGQKVMKQFHQEAVPTAEQKKLAEIDKLRFKSLD